MSDSYFSNLSLEIFLKFEKKEKKSRFLINVPSKFLSSVVYKVKEN